jgi:hypothetical protein
MKSKRKLSVKQSRNVPNLMLILALVLIMLPQCAVKRPSMSTGIVDKVALISTTVNFQQPVGISGPAGIARVQFKNRANEINDLMLHYKDTLHQAVAKNLKTQLGCEVLYGEELHALPKYNELKKKYGNEDVLIKEDENFPEVLISTDDFNFVISETKSGIMFGGAAIPLKSEELKDVIINLCQELNVKHIAFAQFVLTGFRTGLILPTDVYFSYMFKLYNQEGELIANSINTEKTVKILEIDLTESFREMMRAYLYKSEMIELKSVFDKKK